MYLTNDKKFTYQVDDEHLIGNYLGIKDYLSNADDYLSEDATEMLQQLEKKSDDFELFEIYYDAMGGESLRGLDV